MQVTRGAPLSVSRSCTMTSVAARIPTSAKVGTVSCCSLPKDKVETAVVTVTEGFEGTAAECLPKLFPLLFKSSTSAKRACRRGEVLIDGKAANTATVISPGQLVQLIARCLPSQEHLKQGALRAQQIQRLQILYEDDHVACVVKPQGMPTQGKGTSTAQGLLPHSLEATTVQGALRNPCHAHRLDLLTGGLLLAAKSRPALQQLSADFAAHGTIKKRYLAIVKGHLEGRGHIELSLDGKSAATLYESVSHTDSHKWGCLTTVSLWPQTGRKHQLRKHLAYTGTPILGDPKYRGPRPLNKEGVEVGTSLCPEECMSEIDTGLEMLMEQVDRDEMNSESLETTQSSAADTLSDGITDVTLCLWAVELSFPHPLSRELIHIKLDEPRVFEDIRNAEQSWADGKARLNV